MFAARSPQSTQSTQVLGLPAQRYARRRRIQDRHRRGAGLGGLRLAATARWRSITLDRELAAGANPTSSPLLAARAAQLTSPRSRRRVAAGLAGAFQSAQNRRPRIAAALPPQASEVLEARAVLNALRRRLGGSGAVNARGVAMLLELLSDSASPLYQHGEKGLLGSRLRAAAAALDATDRPIVKERTYGESTER
jgi:hypothetical protein